MTTTITATPNTHIPTSAHFIITYLVFSSEREAYVYDIVQGTVAWGCWEDA